MKEIFERILARVQKMSDAEFSAETSKFRDDEVTFALAQAELVQSEASHHSFSWSKAKALTLTLDELFTLASSEVFLQIKAEKFRDLCDSNKAANDERFALAA
jgi:hypothetical protein